MNQEMRFGALCWNQYSDWASFLEAGKRADRLGFYSLWTWDHVYPIVGSETGPMFEGYTTLAAWAMATERVRLGLMVGANPYRNPALVAKMVTTLDHVSGGRMYLGIGSAWDESEARAFGIEMGESVGERLRWLREALPVMRGMLRGEEPSASGPHYAMDGVRNDPQPVQKQLPIIVGGGGENVTLRLVARYADACNIGYANGVEIFKRKEEALLVLEEIYEHNGSAETWSGRPASAQPVGTPEHIAEILAPFVELGYRHVVFGFPAPYDQETMARLIGEVQPRLAALG